MAFGARLRQLRLERGYSLTDLSRLAYYSKGHLSKIENDRHVPSLEYAWQLDTVLNAGGALVSELPGYGPEEAADDGRPPPPPSGLPPQPPVFVGRAAELEALKSGLCTTPATARQPGVWVIDGLPGVGKTALATRVAASLASRFADGVLFIDLHGYTGSTPPLTAAEALGRLLRRLGLPVPDELDERATLWRAHVAERRFLIVADNALHADQVRPLIPATAASRLLVTSRAMLPALDGAFSLTLRPLAQQEGELLLSTLTAGGRTGPGNAEAIVRACGRLPLALTIAAARLRAGTGAADLLDAFAGAAGPLAEMTDGERSVAAAFSASYQALSADVQGTFARLGLSPGADWTVDHVMALDGIDRATAVRRVERLIASRLVEPDAAGRLRCHDLVRSWARQLSAELPAETARTAVERLAAWAVDMTARADAVLEPHRFRPPFRSSPHARPLRAVTGMADAAAWLRAEHGSLVAACRAAYDWGLDELCWQLAYFLRSHFFLTKDYDDWVGTHVVALAAARRTGEVAAEAMTLNNLGVALVEVGRRAEADQQFTTVLTLPAEPGLEYARANARAHRAWLLFTQGEWAEAARQGQAARQFFTDRGMDRSAAITLRGIALAEIEMGSLDEAVGHLKEALATFDELNLKLNAIMAQNCLGEAYLRRREAAAAEKWLMTAARGAREHHSDYEEARSFRLLGEIALSRGDRDAALGYWRAALDHYEKLNAPEAAALTERIGLSQ
jgi:tetratricopeptide (TPR) repeat protein/DNA-binding XRE family transcriptional regulator